MFRIFGPKPYQLLGILSRKSHPFERHSPVYLIRRVLIQSVKDNPHKFLGSLICFSGKIAETYDFCQK